MKSIKTALLGLALVACTASASATEIYNSFFANADMDHPGTLQTYMVSAGASTDAIAAGDTFTYDILFQTVPLTEYDWLNFNITPDVAGSLTFGTAGLYYSTQEAVENFATSTWGNLVTGYGIVTAGVYDLRVTGTFLSDTANFTFAAASDSAAVPEPMSLALMGLGLAGLAGARRRKAKPEQAAEAA